MATELLAAGNTEASSADLVVDVGEVVTVGLKAAERGSQVVIELKDDDGGYNNIGMLGAIDTHKAIAITAPGTYRFTRVAGLICGVFRA